MYKSPAEVLMGFDIDSCSVGYDGKNVYALERACRAITRGFNLVDMSRRSLTYEQRLFKYSKRGFAVAIPGFKRYSLPCKIWKCSDSFAEIILTLRSSPRVWKTWRDWRNSSCSNTTRWRTLLRWTEIPSSKYDTRSSSSYISQEQQGPSYSSNQTSWLVHWRQIARIRDFACKQRVARFGL